MHLRGQWGTQVRWTPVPMDVLDFNCSKLRSPGPMGGGRRREWNTGPTTGMGKLPGYLCIWVGQGRRGKGEWQSGRVAEWQSGRVGESERDGEREGGLYLLEQAELEPWCLAPPSPSQSNPIIHCQPALPLLPFPVQTGPPKKPKQVLPTQSQSQTRVIDLDIDCHNIK